MSNKIKHTPRYLAVQLLEKVSQQGSYSNLSLNQTIQKEQLSKPDSNLLTNLVYGVIQHRLTLEYWLTAFVKNPKKMAPWVKELLLSAIYQMEYLDKIPNRAIFNESIEIAKVKGHAGTRKFVTGVLHAIERQGIADPSQISDPLKRLSIQSSTPVWLVQELTKQVGAKKAQSILATINQAPVQAIRINQKLTTKAALEAALPDFQLEASPVTPLALRAQGGFIPATQAFQTGEVFVQDESAMLAVESMQVQADDQVLDACAAPGGKTTQIAMSLTTGQVTALDIHAHKVKLIEANAKRAQVQDQVHALQLDARKVQEKFPAASFDKILVDAPCSGIGLLRRKPEIKYTKKLQDSENLAKIQKDILDQVAPTLKPGGVLTYSTCTILNQENQGVIDAFLKDHPDFEQVKTQTQNQLKADRDELGLTIYPDDYLSDGFFIATLRKKWGKAYANRL